MTTKIALTERQAPIDELESDYDRLFDETIGNLEPNPFVRLFSGKTSWNFVLEFLILTEVGVNSQQRSNQ